MAKEEYRDARVPKLRNGIGSSVHVAQPKRNRDIIRGFSWFSVDDEDYLTG